MISNSFYLSTTNELSYSEIDRVSTFSAKNSKDFD